MISADSGDGTPVRDIYAPYAGGPTVLRMVLGAQMRKLRQASDITVETAAYTLRASVSKIERLERGRGSCRERDIADLLTLYGIHGEQERAALLRLARQATTPGWWHRYADALPSWFETYVGLEEAASRIRTYEIQFVPSLLQTESYARTAIRRTQPEATAEEVARLVAVRMGRQAILTRPVAPPQFWAVVHEEALRRQLGSGQLMRSQIEHLMAVTELPNVTIRVVPARPEGMVGERSPFTILRFSEPALPDVVYLEHLTSAIYLDKRSDLERYLAAMDRLLLEIGPHPSTMAILKAIHNDI